MCAVPAAGAVECPSPDTRRVKELAAPTPGAGDDCGNQVFAALVAPPGAGRGRSMMATALRGMYLGLVDRLIHFWDRVPPAVLLALAGVPPFGLDGLDLEDEDYVYALWLSEW
jgi:hypothetical protein